GYLLTVMHCMYCTTLIPYHHTLLISSAFLTWEQELSHLLRERESERERERQRERDRERERERELERERERKTERERQRERHRESERKRDTERDSVLSCPCIATHLSTHL